MKKVNIIIGRFQPFTRGHYKCVEYAWDHLHIPTVICMIDTPEENVDQRHPFPSVMLIPLMKDLFIRDNRIETIITVKNANIVKIGELLKSKDLQIASWTCGTDRIDAYREMSKKYHDQAYLSDDFQMLEVKRSDEDVSATKARQALLDDRRDEFNRLVPQQSLSSRLKNDIFAILRDQILKLYKYHFNPDLLLN